MLSHTKYLTVKVPERMDFLNITGEVEKAVKESRVREGLCLVNAMHITASVFINDDEPGLHQDYKRWLEQLAPFDASPARYRHNRTGGERAAPPGAPAGAERGGATGTRRGGGGDDAGLWRLAIDTGGTFTDCLAV